MVREPHLKMGFSIADLTQAQQGLALPQKMLLCGLWLLRGDFYYRCSSRISPSMHDLANRGVNTWAKAHGVAVEDSPLFWDKVADDLQDHFMLCKDPNEITGEDPNEITDEDQNGITGDDLRREFDAVLKGLSGTALGKSDRFSGRQRLMILCMGYDINATNPVLPEDLWSSYDDDELDKLVEVLSNSTVFLPENVNRDLLKDWLAELGKLFT